MFFIGPVLGGLIGFIVGGMIGLPFLGMIIGAFIGSSSRGAYNVHKRGSFWGNDFGAQNRASQAFFESVFSMMGKLASADGNISAQEKQVIQNFMVRQLGMSPQNQQAALEYFNRAAADTTRNFDYWARNLYNHYHNQPAILELAYNILQQLAAADGAMSSGEEEMLNSAQQIFRLASQGAGSSSRQNSGSGSYSSGYSRGGSTRSSGSNLDKAYSNLGCTSTASEDEIKKNYRKRVNEFHPDKIEAKGLPAEFTQFAQEKFQEIQNSYDQIKKARNFS